MEPNTGTEVDVGGVLVVDDKLDEEDKGTTDDVENDTDEGTSVAEDVGSVDKDEDIGLLGGIEVPRTLLLISEDEVGDDTDAAAIRLAVDGPPEDNEGDNAEFPGPDLVTFEDEGLGIAGCTIGVCCCCDM